MRTREELAWAAGFFDGEGSFYGGPRGGAYRRGQWHINASVTNTDRQLLDRFREAVGIGIVCGPYELAGGRRPVYRWAIRSPQGVQAVGAMLWPWLGEYKRERWVYCLTNYRAHRLPTAAALKRAQTHCKNNHPLSGPNCRVTNRQRRCRACERDASARRRAKVRAAAE